MTGSTLEGYAVGLKTIKVALMQLKGGGVKDVNYWKDSVRWLGKASNVVMKRSFCLSAIQIISQVYFQLEMTIRNEIVKACVSLQLADSDVEVLEKVLWLLAEVFNHEERLDGIASNYVCSMVERVLVVGELGSVRFEILPSMIRLCSKLKEEDGHLYFQLTELICQDINVPGKLLWTIADTIPTTISSFDREDPFSFYLYFRIGQLLLLTNSIKARLHIIRACKLILKNKDCPMDLRQLYSANISLIREWLERHNGDDGSIDMDEELFKKYQSALRVELNG